MTKENRADIVNQAPLLFCMRGTVSFRFQPSFFISLIRNEWIDLGRSLNKLKSISRAYRFTISQVYPVNSSSKPVTREP